MKYKKLEIPRKPLLIILTVFMFLAIGQEGSAGKAVLLEHIDDGIIKEIKNGSMWQLDRGKRLRSEQEVEDYLDELNTGPYNDWRLPTKSELYRFYEIFDWKQNGDVLTKIEGDHWLIDQTNTKIAGEWEPDDMCGPVRIFYNKKSGYVRAIRP